VNQICDAVVGCEFCSAAFPTPCGTVCCSTDQVCVSFGVCGPRLV
jgi:hypothetical protein